MQTIERTTLSDRTKSITLKNYRGACLGVPDQTFDYMIAIDYTQNTVLMADWNTCFNDYEVNDSNLTIRLDEQQCFVLADKVNPKTKNVDVWEKYNDFVASIG